MRSLLTGATSNNLANNYCTCKNSFSCFTIFSSNHAHGTTLEPHSAQCLISAPEEKLPKAIVTDKSYDYVTFTFDHFAPEDYSHGYVAMVSSPDFCSKISSAARTIL